MPKSPGNELTALKTVKSFNDLAQRAADKAVDSLTLAWKAGGLAQTAKDSMPHGEWMKFVKTHYVVDQSTVVRWMKFHADVPESKLRVVRNLAAGTKMLEAPKPKGKKTKPKPKTTAPTASPPDSTENTSEATEAPGVDVEAPGTGKCPNCQKSKWEEDEDGFSCVECRHPWGEPAGDVDDNQFKRKQQKAGGGKGKLPKQYDRSALLKTWTQGIGPLIRQVTRIADGVGEKHGKYHKAVRVHLDKATDIMTEWMGEK